MIVEPQFWNSLFKASAPDSRRIPVQMNLLTKHGKPLLLLPNRPPLAARALELYPAQTARSRFARLVARWLLKARLPVGVSSVQVDLSPEDPFVQWLSQLAEHSQHQTPPFAVLAGNPSSPGQRLIILLFDSAGRPASVVKAGLTEAARKLIEQERLFLESVPRTIPGILSLRGTFTNAQLEALALDFLPGRSPREADDHCLPQVLSQWLHPERQIHFHATRVGRELAASCADHPIFQAHAASLQDHSCRAAVYHGDFAPWNVRVSPQGTWVALDWERGEINGLPVWDWFHYVIQKGILVQHLPAEGLAQLVKTLFVRDEFKAYAQASGTAGHERALVLLYLLHHAKVVRPSEGLQVTNELMKRLAAKWG